MKYDDASSHYGGEFPETSPQEYGGTHIALLMRWCFQQGWASSLHAEDSPMAVDSVIRGTLSSTRFLFDHCDGKFTEEDVAAKARPFLRWYYGDEGPYLDDYVHHFAALMYLAPESAHDWPTFERMVAARFEEFSGR